MVETMLNLSEFSHNPHPSGVKMLENFITRGISGGDFSGELSEAGW